MYILKNRTIKYFVFSLVVVLGFSSCDFFNVPDNKPIIKGEKVTRLDLTQQEHDVMHQIFTKANPVMREYIKKYDRLSEEVVMITSKNELLAFCPDSITPPEIDFEKNCLVFGMVATPTSRTDIKEVDLYVQENGEATFYSLMIAASMDNVIGLAFPYGVFAISGDEISKLKIQTTKRFY